MLILHAAYSSSNLWLWAEQSQTSQQSDGEVDARTDIQTHPFATTAGNLLLRLRLEKIPTGGRLHPADVVLRLPSVGGAPLASSQLILNSQVQHDSKKPVLNPWSITALRLPPAQAVSFLTDCRDRSVLAPGLAVGHDLVFWILALRMAGSLVARQQFLPGLERDASRTRARWVPLLAGDDADRVAKLAEAMPEACRAIVDSPENKESASPTRQAVVRDFIGDAVDFLVRDSGTRDTKITPHRGHNWRPAVRSRFRAVASAADSIHDRWLHALRSGDDIVAGVPFELETLQNQIEQWQRPLTLAAASPWKLSFRLTEPDSGVADNEQAAPDLDAAWRLQYFLQARADPSLQMPLNDVWRSVASAAGSSRKSSRRSTPMPLEPGTHEYLLTSLGQASAVSPIVEGSLRTKMPAGCDLNTESAFQFLTRDSLLLQQGGFGVFLPSWWSRQGTRTRLTVKAEVKSPKLQAKGQLALDELVDFDWKLALGDRDVSFHELQSLAAMKDPLVRLRGQWVQLNREEIEAALKFWKKRGGERATVRELLQLALGAGPEIAAAMGLPETHQTVEVAADGWLKGLLDRLRGSESLEPLPQPRGFEGLLRPYQERGFAWLGFLRQWGFGACLADDMGLGKTVQVLALLQREWELTAADSRRPVLLICPTSVVTNWAREAARFTPDLPVMVHHGLGRHRGAAFQEIAGRQAAVISSYALMHRDLQHLSEVEWAGIVLDEAQNIKNAETRQAKAVKSITAGYRIALTGTPVENSVGDLWSIMEFLNPGMLGTLTEFKRRFFVPIQTGSDPRAAENLKRVTGPFILRRLKTDKSIISDLPEKMEMKVFCTLTREQASLYAAVVNDAMKSISGTDGIQRKGVVLATLMKLKQVCNHPAQFLKDNSARDTATLLGRSGKLARLTEMIEEVLSGSDRALIFSQFHEMGEILQRHLQETFGSEVLFLHGGTPKGGRDVMVERFQDAAESEAPRIFLLSLKAGGVGLNLTRANHVFHFDRWWNPAVENQATDRAFRIGQQKNVQVHKFLCAGTLEEKIDTMIEQKQRLAANVIGAGENWLTELSTDGLRDLFTLRPDAVQE